MFPFATVLFLPNQNLKYFRLDDPKNMKKLLKQEKGNQKKEEEQNICIPLKYVFKKKKMIQIKIAQNSTKLAL